MMCPNRISINKDTRVKHAGELTFISDICPKRVLTLE